MQKLKMLVERVKDLSNVGRTSKPSNVERQSNDIITDKSARFSLNQLLRVVNNRKSLLPTKMGEKRRSVINTIAASANRKSLAFKGTSFGNKNYKVQMSFFGVNFVDKQDEVHTIKLGNTGSKKRFIAKIDREKTPVGVRCECFTGDTLIPLLDGYSVPIKDLVGKKDINVYSFDLSKNEYTVGEAYNCRKTGEKSKIVKVTFDNGNSIKCTPDHKFLLKDGTYKEVKDLEITDFLMPLYRKLKNSNKDVKISNIEDAGYEDVYCMTVSKYENFAIDVDGGKTMSSGVIVSNCKDFGWRFEFWDARALALLGRTRPEVQNYDWQSVPPERKQNPKKLTGFCKHLLSFAEQIQKRGFLS